MGIRRKMSGPWIWSVLEPFRAVALSSVTVWWKSCVSEVSVFSSGQAVQDFALCYSVSSLLSLWQAFSFFLTSFMAIQPFSRRKESMRAFLYASILINFSKKVLLVPCSLLFLCFAFDIGKFVYISVGLQPKKSNAKVLTGNVTLSPKIVILCTSLGHGSTFTSNSWLNDPVIWHNSGSLRRHTAFSCQSLR